MQELYLSDLGNTNPNVASDVATPGSNTPVEGNKEESTQTLSPKKGESTVVDENAVPNYSDWPCQKLVRQVQEALNYLLGAVVL